MSTKIMDVQKENHNTNEIIDNTIWEIAKLLKPNSYIDPQIVKKAKEQLIKTLENY